MPKERIVTRIPNDRLTVDLKNQIGLFDSVINPEIRTIRELIISLRHWIAHFVGFPQNENTAYPYFRFYLKMKL